MSCQGQCSVSNNLLNIQMGNESLFPASNPLDQLLNRFTITQELPENSTFYLTDNNSGQQLIMRELTTNDHEQRTTLNGLAALKLASNKGSISRLIEKIDQKENSYCSTRFKMYVIFERPLNDLRTEIHHRRAKDSAFSEEELLRIIKAGVLGLTYLKQIQHPHQAVTSNNILLNHRGQYTLSDPWLNFEPSIHPSFNHLYHSPEKLQVINNLKFGKVDWYSSDLFSLGMVLLEAIHLQYMDDVYKKKEINYATLSERVGKIPSPLIKTYVQRLLGTPRKRLSVVHQMEIFCNPFLAQESVLTNGVRTPQNTTRFLRNELYKPSSLKPNKKDEEDQKKLSNITKQKTPPEERTDPMQQAQIKLPEKDLEDTKAASPISTKEPVTSLQQPSTSVLTESITELQVKQNADCDTNWSKANDKSEDEKFVEGPTMSGNILETNHTEEDLKSEGAEKQDSPKSSQIQPQQEYHLLSYDYEQPQPKTLRIQPPEEESSLGYQQNVEPKELEEYTPPKKHSLHKRYNSTIMEISDSENQSGGEQEETQFVIEKYQIGSKYEGYKKNGMRNGKGKFNYHDGGYYDGYWKNDKMNGEGKLYYPSGKVAYEGEWRSDEFHGYGKVYNDSPVYADLVDYQDFNLLEEEWEYYEGNLVSDTKQGSGRIKFSNGELFEGDFVDDKMQGKGKFHTKDGKIISGIWKSSRLVLTL